MPSFFQNLFKKDPDVSAVETPDAPLDRQTEPPSLLSAMNLASPFATAASEQFTIRELIMLLPPQLVRTESMPGDQPVALPLDLLRGSMQQGRPALRLSQIYMACPFLFTRQVQPAEDLEIVLPFQKVKRMLESGATAASPFTAVAPPSRMDSPFATAGSPFVQNGGPHVAAASPFAVRAPEPAPQNEVLSPFSADALAPLESPATPQNPFQRMEAASAPPRPATSPFHLVTPVAAPAQPQMPTVPPASVPVMPMSTPSPFAAAGNGNGKARTAPVAVRTEVDGTDVNSHAPLSAPAPFPVTTEPPPSPLAPARPEPAMVPGRTPTGSVPAGGEIRVSLLALLRDVTAEDLGFDPTAVPAHVEAVLPLDAVTPQLATGRVEISVEELRHGVEDRFRPAFARANPGLRFVVPLSEIFRSLPPAAIPAPHAAEHIPISTSPFQTPFALKADEDANGGAPALPPLVAPAPPAPAHPVAQFPVIPSLTAEPKPHSAPVVLPPAPAAAFEPEVPRPAAPVPFQIPVTAAPAPPAGVAPIKLPGLPSLPKLPGLSARPSPFARPPGMTPAPADPPEETGPAAPQALPFPAPLVAVSGLPPVESHEDLGRPFSAASLQNQPPAPAPVVPTPEPFDPSRLFSAPAASKSPPPFAAPVAPVAPVAAPAPVPVAPRPATAPTPAAAPAVPPIEFNFGETPDMTLVTLRAIFDTDDDLTTHQIVDRLAQLPGIRSAVGIINGGVIASGHASGSEEVARFIASAPKNCEYLTGLAESMGYGRSGSFTMRAGAGVRTIIIENGNCLAVLHDKSGFGPGVRDKLLLTVRLLGELAD